MFTVQIMQTAAAHGKYLLYPKDSAYGAVRGNAPQVFMVFGYKQRKDLRVSVDLTCFVNEAGLYAMFTSPTDPKIRYVIANYCPCSYDRIERCYAQSYANLQTQTRQYGASTMITTRSGVIGTMSTTI